MLRKLLLPLALLLVAGEARAETITITQTITNTNSSPAIFLITTSSSFAPIACPCVATSVLTITFTDLDGDGLTFIPIAPPGLAVDADGVPEAWLGYAETIGNSLVNLGVDLGPAFSAVPAAPGSAYSFSFSDTRLLGGDAFDLLQLVRSFQLSVNDRVQFSGSLTLEQGQPTAPVPEPTTMLLLGTGLVGVVGAARRRRRVKTE